MLVCPLWCDSSVRVFPSETLRKRPPRGEVGRCPAALRASIPGGEEKRGAIGGDSNDDPPTVFNSEAREGRKRDEAAAGYPVAEYLSKEASTISAPICLTKTPCKTVLKCRNASPCFAGS